MAAGMEQLTDDQATRVLAALQQRDRPPQQIDGTGMTSWRAPCPCHGDDGQPLVLTKVESTGRWLLACHGPCGAVDVRYSLDEGPAPWTAADADVAAPAATWGRIDLSSVLDGTHTPQVPELLARTDGVCLLYSGRVHSFHGESESGKSWAALVVAAQELTNAGDVLMLDYESDAATNVGRLLALGVDPEAIRHGFDYRRPDAAPDAAPGEAAAFDGLLAQRYDLVILDGVTEALATAGVSSLDNDEVTGWVRRVVRRIAASTGAAVVLVDHVTKSNDDRGRFAIGSQAKMATLDGAAYVVEVIDPLGAGMCGRIALRVAKDRPGGVRPHCGPWRKSDRTQEAAVITLDSTHPDRTVATVDPWRDRTAGAGKAAGDDWMPTELMQRVSRSLQLANAAMSRSAIESSVRGRGEFIRQAIDALITHGYAAADGPALNGGKPTIRLIKPYQQPPEPVLARTRPQQAPIKADAQPADPVPNGTDDRPVQMVLT